MKKILMLSIISGVVVGCGSSKAIMITNKAFVGREVWVQAYKDQMFFACLEESYSHNDTIFRLIRNSDAFNPYEGLRPEDIRMAHYLGKQLIVNIQSPVMCEGCEGRKNYYMATCLHYYNSKELDSIANLAFLDLQRQNEEYYGKRK